MLFKEDLISLLEAVLFVSIEPLPKEKITEILNINKEETNEILEEYRLILSMPGRGVELIKVAGGYKLATKSIYSESIEKIVKPQGGQLSKAALETLTIIAYKQPITRSEIENIRGVNVDAMVHKLLEKELIIEVGRKEVPGHPNLYGTTDKFLIQLGINSLEELSEIEENIEIDEIITEEELDINNKGLEMEIIKRDEYND